MMAAWVEMCDYEIAGMGTVESYMNDYYITSVEIFEQSVNGGRAEMDAQAIMAHMMQLADSDRVDDLPKYYFQWHSHVNMEAVFSSVDEDFMRAWPAPVLISLVLNKRGEYSMRWEHYGTPAAAYMVHPWITVERDPAVMQHCREQFELLVTTPERSSGISRMFKGKQEEAPLQPVTLIRPEDVASHDPPEQPQPAPPAVEEEVEAEQVEETA